ncbi:sulfotransferase 6B1-like [Conger conger]|uniref:sulfotransferase 6B1-like n=1 Tax=Conger conger TaxID=82655 RepID=UPI002A5A36E9|nr:sulfotransferase 6B1-like [Conger conger]
MSSNPEQMKIQAKMAKGQDMKDEDKLFRYKGVLYPTIMCPLENLKAMEHLEARHDDVMLVAYPKSGFNWMTAVVRKIMAVSTGGEVRWGHPHIEFFDPEAQQLLSQAPSPRCMGTHMRPENMPPSFAAKKTKMLVVVRNPKDTAVSFYHFCKNIPVLPTPESWDTFYTQYMSGDVPWGSYFDHALAWEKCIDDPNVMIVTYEEMKEDLSKGVQQISQFFGFPLSKEQIQTIAEDSTFSSMKENSQVSHGILASSIFRKGEVGDWKNHFSEAQSRMMDAEFEKRLAGTKLGAKLKYDLYCK